MPKLQGEVTVTFVRGGVSTKTGTPKPYLQVSNGRSEFFITIPKSLEITSQTFENFEEGDSITLEVEVLVGTANVKLLGVVE